MADRWHIPPWEVERAPAIWFLRQQTYDHYRQSLSPSTPSPADDAYEPLH